MPDMREGDLGTAACYLTVERLALQAGVESPFWDEASLLMGGCEEPWYKKPLTPRRLRSFLKRYGGSLPDDAGRRGHAASVFADVMRLHGIPMEDGADNLGALYVRRAESVGMTVAFLATGCTLADMAAITGFCEERLSSASRAHGTAIHRGGYTDSPIPRITTAFPRPSHHQMTLTSLGMIGYAHVGDDEGTSSPRTPQRHRPPRRFTAAPMTRRLTRWIMGADGIHGLRGDRHEDTGEQGTGSGVGRQGEAACRLG